MNRVVVFTKNNARVLHGPDAEAAAHLPNAVVDPDLSRVRGIPPHHWKLENGKVIPMSEAEKAERNQDHNANGVDNVVQVWVPTRAKDGTRSQKAYLLVVGVALAIAALIYVLSTTPVQ